MRCYDFHFPVNVEDVSLTFVRILTYGLRKFQAASALILFLVTVYSIIVGVKSLSEDCCCLFNLSFDF